MTTIIDVGWEVRRNMVKSADKQIDSVLERLLTSSSYQSQEEVLADLNFVKEYIELQDGHFAGALRKIEEEYQISDGELDRFHPAHILEEAE